MRSFRITYFNWLFDQVTTNLVDPYPLYRSLFGILHDTPFAWTVLMDKNRAADALELRDEFLEGTGLSPPPGWENSTVSVLEMLIRFSRRAEFVTDIPAEEWFWEFLHNLHLSKFKSVASDDAKEIDEILYRFIWREYDFNGEGGLFPLRNASKDQRHVELWYQFHAYLDQPAVARR